MRLKILSIFIITILIPTFSLAYFGLLAVQGEQSIIERSLKQKYRSIADIIESEISVALSEAGPKALSNISDLEGLLKNQLSLFEEEAAIFNQEGKNISKQSPREINKSIYSRKLKNIPYYTIAVYENHPILYEKLESRKEGLFLYVTIIVVSVICILLGAAFSLYSLSKEWRFAEMKSEFVSHLSHDLRRPLTSIRMFSEMLSDNTVPDEESKQTYYKIISNESDKLTHLANNILDFSRIEKGGIKYNFQSLNIENMIEDNVSRFKAYMREQDREVVVDVEKGLPEMKADAHAISQALMNLLTNADKYSPEGEPIVIKAFKQNKDIVIQVMDKGSGIPLSEQKRIFNKYYRAANKVETEGSGLGLTLVKYMAQAHKGKVKVASEMGKGTTFSLILPV